MMNKESQVNRKFSEQERGAALVTVLMISVLLGIACIALLSSVGANSRNSTDVLSETKAYYAAESGLQSTINILRHSATTVKYSQAAASPYDLSNVGLTYNCSGKVSVGGTSCSDAETFYSLNVTDPDDSGRALTFVNSAGFSSSNVSDYTLGSTQNNFRFTYTPAPSCQVTFVPSYVPCVSGETNPKLGTITITKTGTGANLPQEGIPFMITYAVTAPRSGNTPIVGKIKQLTGRNSDILTVEFSPNTGSTLGSTITLCSAYTGTCPASGLSFTFDTSTNTPPPQSIYMTTTPAEPYRLKVLSTGYGPNKAKKQLEAVIQANLLNGETAPSAFTLQGPVSTTSISLGTSGAFKILGETGTVSQPSIGVIDQQSLTNLNNSIRCNNCIISPPPAVVSSVPTWLQTPQNLDLFVNSFRQASLASSPRRYFTTSSQPTSYGDYDRGTGLTFCDGDCTVPGNMNGGGTLIVTGTFRTNGDFNFKGLIVITGPGGWQRQGNGGGVVTGSVVIAPYNADSLVSNTFTLPPTYNSNGSGNSTVDNDAVTVSQAFNGTNALTDLMLGIAEK